MKDYLVTAVATEHDYGVDKSKTHRFIVSAKSTPEAIVQGRDVLKEQCVPCISARSLGSFHAQYGKVLPFSLLIGKEAEENE